MHSRVFVYVRYFASIRHAICILTFCGMHKCYYCMHKCEGSLFSSLYAICAVYTLSLYIYKIHGKNNKNNNQNIWITFVSFCLCRACIILYTKSYNQRCLLWLYLGPIICNKQRSYTHTHKKFITIITLFLLFNFFFCIFKY